MKKINFILAALLLCLGAACAHSKTVSAFGACVTIPDGWKTMQGEQVLIYNAAETAAVIIDQVAKTGKENAESVAASLAEAVGVKKDSFQRDKCGAISMEFVQNGEPVSVRVVDDEKRVLMVYSFGRDAQAKQIASSVGDARTTAAPSGQTPAQPQSPKK